VMSEKTPPKSSYVNYTEEEILATESGIYILQIGSEVFSLDGKMGFTRERVEGFYDDAVAGLEHMVKTGTAEEIKEAKMCLRNIRIIPLKIH
jgi:hypothetical protein